MSEIRSNTIANAAGTGPSDLTGQSAAKIICFLSEAAAIQRDLNVSSATDNGTGDYTLNYTNAMDDGLSASLVSQAYGTSNGALISSGSTTTTSSSVFCRDDGGSLVDKATQSIGHGDLA